MRTFLKGIFLLLLTWTFACNSGNQDSTSDTTETTALESSDANTEETTESNDQPNRPSPARTATGTIGGANITINYSSPSVKGRTIWGGLVPFGKVWRTGANEATTFEVSSDITIEGQTLPAGKYAFFTIPNEDKWTLIFNAQPDQWGAYDYDSTKDVLQVEVTPQTLEESVEAMEFAIEGAMVTLKWEKLAVPFKVNAG